MDNNILKKLGQILDDSFNNRLEPSKASQKINGILHNKSTKRVLRELYDYICTISGQEKNKATLVVVMSLLRRRLDAVQEIAQFVLKYKLSSNLLGGLSYLFAGDSVFFSIKVDLNDHLFKNKYEYVIKFNNFKYRNYMVLFLAIDVLNISDSKKFESLALSDKTNLILLNMAKDCFSGEPSRELIDKLLQDKDELRKNIGLFFISRSITTKIGREIEFANRCRELGSHCSIGIEASAGALKESIELFYDSIEKCNKCTQVSLLTNYLLVHRDFYPEIFAHSLMSSKNQEEFIFQITSTGKVKTLSDVNFLVYVISHTPVLNEKGKHISKNALYRAIISTIKSFINNRKGIYTWSTQEKNNMTCICQILPKKYIEQLRFWLIKEGRKLMANSLDEMIRFEIYIEDKNQYEIISGIVNVLESSRK